MAEMICYDDFRYYQWRGRVKGKGLFFKTSHLEGMGEKAEDRMDVLSHACLLI